MNRLGRFRTVMVARVATLFAVVLLAQAPSITVAGAACTTHCSFGSIPPARSSPISATAIRSEAPPSLSWATDWHSLAEQAFVANLIAHMSLDEEIGQMIMVGFDGSTMSPAVGELIKRYHVGGAILYAVTGNVVSGPQIQYLVEQLQSQASVPLLIATDQEGGQVNRMLSVLGPLPSAYDIGSTGDPTQARRRGEQDVRALSRLGINLDLAPVVDVLNVPFGEGDINDRSFGTTPRLVTEMAGAYLQGLQEGDHVAGTLKHFPGLGDVPVDPHQQAYTLSRSRTDLEHVDWAPYRALIATGQVDAVMATHITVAAIDATEPATLSYPVLTGVLRDLLGFKGVIITDGVYMNSLLDLVGTSDYPSWASIYLKLVEAGNDIICSLGSFGEAQLFVQTIHDAVMSGTMSKRRIDQSVGRILVLKLRYGVLATPHGG
jgi:beta-N-acetylhexosaminidase